MSSMVVNMTGGGGAGLNFKVVGGTTAPANPSENTIWVNTSSEITGYIFGGEQPSNPTSGTVWFPVKESGTVGFSVTKKNPIYIYPKQPKQYVSYEWSNCSAQIYLSGTWTEFVNVVWQFGDDLDYWLAYGNPTPVTKENTSGKAQFSMSGYNYSIYTPLIDISSYEKLTVYASANWPNCPVGLTTSNPASKAEAVMAVSTALDNTETPTKKEIDISSLSGEYRIALTIMAYQQGSKSVFVKSVELS